MWGGLAGCRLCHQGSWAHWGRLAAPRLALWGPPRAPPFLLPSVPPISPCAVLTGPPSFSSPGLGPRRGGPRQLWRGGAPAVHAAKDHAGQPQGPHILPGERARHKPFPAPLQSTPQVAQDGRRLLGDAWDGFLCLQTTPFCNEQVGYCFKNSHLFAMEPFYIPVSKSTLHSEENLFL